MTWIIDQLIAFLTELRAQGPIMKLVTLAGISGLIALVVGIPVWLMRRKVEASVTAYEALEARLRTALTEAARLKAEVERLEAETPAVFVAHHARETEDENDERAMALAEAFLERQREALLLAFRTRMDEAVRQSVEDGAPAFVAARSWTLAALALAPRDASLHLAAILASRAQARRRRRRGQ